MIGFNLDIDQTFYRHPKTDVAELEVVSSDVVRKRLAGVGAHEHAREQHYSSRFSHATYTRLARAAHAAIGHGSGVVVDATCRARADRAPLLTTLTRAGARPLFVRCTVPLELALARAHARMDDRDNVSDATPAIVREQFRSFEDLAEVPAKQVLRLETSGRVSEQLADVARAIDTRALHANAAYAARPVGSGVGT